MGKFAFKGEKLFRLQCALSQSWHAVASKKNEETAELHLNRNVVSSGMDDETWTKAKADYSLFYKKVQTTSEVNV